MEFRAFAGRRRVAMSGTGKRCHQDVKAGEPSSPAEVEILVPRVEAFIEQPRALPSLTRDQHGARRHAEHLDHPVELPLVDLPGLQGCVRVSEPIGGSPHVAQEARLIPVDDLGTHDPHVFYPHPDGGFNEPGHGVGIERRVVVEHEQIVGVPNGRDLERRLNGAGQPSLVGRYDHAAFAERLRQEINGAVARRVIDGHDTHPRIGLSAERRQAATQPSGGVPNHEDDQNGRGNLGGGFGGGSSHAMRSRAARSLARPEPEQAEGGLTAPLHTSARRMLSACEPPACVQPSSCEQACEQPSSCELRACEQPSSCELRACEQPSSCEPRACEQPSSCELPACEQPSSCVLRACEPQSSCEPRACVQPSSCGLRACEQPSSCELRACGPRSSCEPQASWPSPFLAPFRRSVGSGRHALQASTLPFTHPAPHAVTFVAAEGVVEAFDPNGAFTADPLGLPR